MIRIYTFTYAGDAQEAVACVRCARTALPEAVVTVVDDSAAPVPPEARRALVAYGARYRRSSFPRCGNLRGPECVRGIITTLAKGAADITIVTLLDKPQRRQKPIQADYVGLRCTPPDTGSPGTRPNGPPTEIATP